MYETQPVGTISRHSEALSTIGMERLRVKLFISSPFRIDDIVADIVASGYTCVQVMYLQGWTIRFCIQSAMMGTIFTLSDRSPGSYTQGTHRVEVQKTMEVLGATSSIGVFFRQVSSHLLFI